MPWRRAVTWLKSAWLVYRWPLPTALLYATVTVTNPSPYLFASLDGNLQRSVFALAAFGCLLASVWPKHMWSRNIAVFTSTMACALRILTLTFNPGRYTLTEVVAFATVWVVVGTLVVQMTILTWPAVSEDRVH